MSQDTLTAIQKLLAKATDGTADEFPPDRALNEIGIDSLSVIDVLFQLEDLYKIRIPSEGSGLQTVDDIVQLIDRLKAEPVGKSG